MSLTESTSTHTVTVDGAEVTYFDSVTPGEVGRPLVLVHGTAGNTASHYGHLFPMMATRTRVIAVDWSPLAERGAELTVEALVAQVKAAVDDALGADTPFDLLGYSLGSVVATKLAGNLGNRVQHLVLVAGWLVTDAQQELRNSVWKTLYDSGNVDALSRYTAFCAFSGPFLRQLEAPALQQALSSIQPTEFVAAQMDLNARVDIRSAAEDVTARTLIVSCNEDIMVPPHHQYELFGAIDDARLTSMTSGHGFFVERPAELMQIVDLYLREPDRYQAGSVIPETHT